MNKPEECEKVEHKWDITYVINGKNYTFLAHDTIIPPYTINIPIKKSNETNTTTHS